MLNNLLSRNSKTYHGLRAIRNQTTRTIKRLSQVHPTTYVHRTARVPSDLVTGRHVFIGAGCWLAPRTEIGEYTMFAPRVAIVGDDHVWDTVGVPIQFAGRPEQRTTLIGRDTWIGYGAILMRGVAIGECAVVAAGSVVTTDVPKNEIWGGVPARRIRNRFDEEQFAEHRRILDTGPVRPLFSNPQELRASGE